MASFGSRLKELRTANRCGQKELGALIGVSDSSIRKYESGDRTPTPEAIRTLAKYFNVSTDYLLGNTPTNNINIGTNNGAVSGNGNATVIEYPLTDDKLEVSLRAMLGDSVETDDIVQALTDGVTVLKDLDDFDRQNLRLYLQGIVNVIKKAKANGDKRITISAAQ